MSDCQSSYIEPAPLEKDNRILKAAGQGLTEQSGSH
jgi:hypothetical protein